MAAAATVAVALPGLTSATAAETGTRNEITVLGADSGRIAVLRGESVILAARIGRPLTEAAQADLRIGWRETYTDLTGKFLRWTEEPRRGAGVVRHRLDLSTGKERTGRTREELVAWTPLGWIGYQNDRLFEHLRGGIRRELLQLPPTKDVGLPYVVSDGERTLVYRNGRLLLVTDGGRTTQMLYDAQQGPKLLSGMALTPHSAVWSLAPAPDGSAGGKVLRQIGTTEEPVVLDSPGELAAATDDSIVVVATGSSASPTAADRHSVHRWDGTSWSEVDLPGPAAAPGREETTTEPISGPVTDGETFYLSVGTKIYSLSEDSVLEPVTR
ncbi:hypothetical protein GCM10027456_20230 [Kineosporia babensis]